MSTPYPQGTNPADPEPTTLAERIAALIGADDDNALTTALGAGYLPLSAPVVVPGSDLVSRNSSTGAITAPSIPTYLGARVLALPDAGSGDELTISPLVRLPPWESAHIDIVCEASAAASGNFRLRALVIGNTLPVAPGAVETNTLAPATVWTDTITPPADFSGVPAIFTIQNAATFTVTPGQYWAVQVRRLCTDAADTNTGTFRVYALVVRPT